jgi:hypothetical protein
MLPGETMKATKAQIQMRVDDLVTFRLDGAEFWHVREYGTEREKVPGSAWYRGDGEKSFSEATLRRYIRKADDQIAESCRSFRKKRLRRHLAQRRNHYAKAVALGDIRAALAVADSEAKLLGLFPAKGIEVGNMNVVQVNSASANNGSPQSVREIFAKLPTEHVLADLRDLLLGQMFRIGSRSPLKDQTFVVNEPGLGMENVFGQNWWNPDNLTDRLECFWWE